MGLMRYYRRHHVPTGQLRLTTRRERNTTAKPFADCSMPAMLLRCALCKAQSHCGARNPPSVPGAVGTTLITSNNTTHDFPISVRTSGYQSVGVTKALCTIWAAKLTAKDTGMAWHGVAWRGVLWLSDRSHGSHALGLPSEDLVLAQTLHSGDQNDEAQTAASASDSGPGRMMYGSNLARKSPVVDPSEAS
ncbi:hypothetical protein BDV11DRAFT_208215 [Aspergillus similis]